MRASLAHYFTPEDSALVAWFLRDEPLWLLLFARWKLRRMSPQERLRLTIRAQQRIRAGHESRKSKLKKAAKRLNR